MSEDLAQLEQRLGEALTLVEQRRFEEAERAFAPLLAIRPTFDWAHYSYACFCLLQGDYARGWRYFERRFGIPGYSNFPASLLRQPRWNGELARNKTLFLHMDQGFGDAIQCARWLPKIRRRVGKLIIGAPPVMQELMQSIEPDCEILLVGQTFPSFDMHLHFFSIPALFDATPQSIPPAPYLTPDPARIAAWRSRLGAGSGPVVGLIWQGSPGHLKDASRSIPLAAMAPILTVPGVRFVSLQIGAGLDQLQQLPEGITIPDFGSEIAASPHGFMEGAAAMAALDLIITIDSGPAHLAGAIGQKAWVLLHEPPDWRWLLDREDSVWYPSLRLFRQPAIGNWAPAIDRVAGELAAFAASFNR